MKGTHDDNESTFFWIPNWLLGEPVHGTPEIEKPHNRTGTDWPQTRSPEPRLPHPGRTAQDSTLEITQTRSSYFGEYRRLHNRDHRNSIHIHRWLDQAANLNPVAGYRTTDHLCNPTPLRWRTVSYPWHTRPLVCRANVDSKELVPVLVGVRWILSQHCEPEWRFNAGLW